jgi:hypothetical protein
MKPQKLLMVLGVSILIYYVARQVQIRHKFVENLTEDRILSDAELNEIGGYYMSLGQNKPADPSKLSNKAKVFVNMVTEHPFTALTDSAIGSLKDDWDKPVKKEKFIATTFMIILRTLKDYQTTYMKEKSIPSKGTFIARVQEMIKKDEDIFGFIEFVQFAISDNYPVPPPRPGVAPMRKDEEAWIKRIYAPNRHGIIQIFGKDLININLDGSKTVNLSGPLQTNIIDLTYNYLYPNQDIFTWIMSLFSSEK